MPARILNPESLNSLEVIQVVEYMDKKYPNIHYNITSGNQCVWVYWNHVNLYVFFSNGKIADIQVD
jgi:hypothetical protein